MSNSTPNRENETRPVQQPVKAAKPRSQRLTRKMKDAIMADLGLTKVRGAVSGRIYYE